MRKPKSQYSPEQKLKMVMESLSYPDGIGAYCRSKGIRDTQIYKWKEQLLSSANAVYGVKKKDDSKEAEYQSKLIRKDEIISELVSENITLKKNLGM
jgi:transposase-like protein